MGKGCLSAINVGIAPSAECWCRGDPQQSPVCGRYTHLFTWAQLHRLMSLGNLTPEEQQEIEKALKKRYNVAPQQQAPVIIAQGPTRGLKMFRWGLIPFWSKDPSIANRTINARSETIATSPAFREAFKKHRCLVPASGFYEWQHVEGSTRKQPWYIHAPENGILFFAGVFDEWISPESGESLRTFSILTTGANELMRPLHTRMPVVLTKPQQDLWLDAGSKPDELAPLLAPCEPSLLEAYRVGTKVNSVRFDDPECIRRDERPIEPPSLFG